MEHLLPLFVTWDVNPALLHIGSFEIRYYGLLWAIALGISAYIFHNIMQREGLSEKAFDSIFWFGVISTVVGARLGHCLFYDPGYLVLFIILWWMYYKKDTARRRPGLMFGFFLIVLFGTRFLIEFIKNPQEDFEVNMLLNMGQLLSIPFILTGIVILWCALRKPPLDPAPLKKSFSGTPAKRK